MLARRASRETPRSGAAAVTIYAAGS